MASLWKNEGKLVKSGGVLCKNDECPCDEAPPEGTLVGCHNDLMPDCYEVTVAGVTDNGGDGFACGPVLCLAHNDTWTMTGTSGTSWGSDYKAIDCPGGVCNNRMIATLGIVAGHPFNGLDPPCNSSSYCVWTLRIAGDDAEDDCDGTMIYRGCFLKTEDPLTPKVLTFVSGSTACNDEPATLTVNAC